MQHPAGPAGRKLVERFAGVAVMLEAGIEMGAVGLGPQSRQQCPHGVDNVAEDAELDRRAAADRFGPQVHLGDARRRRIELPVGEISAEHQQPVAILHRVIAGGKADQPGHADIVGVFPLDVLLAAQRMDDRRLQRFGELEDLGMGAGAAAAAQQRHPSGAVQQIGEAAERLIRGRHHRAVRHQAMRLWRRGDARRSQRHVARYDDDADAALGGRPTDRGLDCSRHLLGGRNQLAIAAAFAEQLVGVGLLKITGADLGRGNVGGDRNDRHARALAVVEAVDQVQVTRAAAAGADRELAGDMRLGTGGKSGDLLVAQMQPGDPAMAAQ